ncbi:MAG: tRNA (adenosine(37)-N6)-threonylcarbamoyltransferase complex transferase subunit TsaD [Chloroflexi bacterium]|nr:tRNA (adenosine(37)-N6)-threonylcarbamoyltransferase complex transferase subunit TsaD [Chloroflexota bacterium]
MHILGIETSCDETAAAVVEDGRLLRSNVVASQVKLHAAYGGVVPEVAARQHLVLLSPVVEQALRDADRGWDDLDAVAVTRGPGLAGALLVGLNFAKAVALARGKALVGVNHMEGHVYANWLLPGVEPQFPLLCLLVSGAHTDLILMRGHGQYRLLGRTRDDAAGEAFDKVARLLGLGYPGGPAIQRAAEGGDSAAFAFPRAMLRSGLDFSFSGLKTAVLRAVERLSGTAVPGGQQSDLSPAAAARRDLAAGLPVADLAASFQRAVVDVLVEKTSRAASRYRARQVAVGGGVAANALLRAELPCRLGGEVLVPPLALCTDNAAMIAACGYYRLTHGQRDGWDLDAAPSLRLA